MKHYDAALPLMTENLERTRRLLGDDSADTVISMNNMADLHDSMGHRDLALPLFHDTLQRSRRVLGNRHPYTLDTMARLGNSLVLCGESERAEGIALLEEAVAGQTAVLGAGHPDAAAADAQFARNALHSAKNDESEESEDGEESEGDADADEEEEQEQEQEDNVTIADRIRKRRRRA